MSRPGWKAAVLVVAVLDLVGAQIAKRVLPGWFSDMPGSNPRVQSPVFHHGFRPLMSTMQRFGPRLYPLHTNSLGFIDGSARTIDPAGSGCRVLVMGDSFAEGLGNAWPDTFAGRLAARWAGQGMDVLNAAVVSYSPSVHFRKLKHLLDDRGLRVDAVLLFVDLSDVADEWEQYDFDSSGNVTARARDWIMRGGRGDATAWDRAWFRLQDNSMLVHLARDVGVRLLRRWQGPTEVVPRLPDPPSRAAPEPPLGGIAPPPIRLEPEAAARRVPDAWQDHRARWTIDAVLYDKFAAFGLAKAAAMMDRLLVLLRERRIDLTIFVYPWPDQIVAGDRDSVQVRFWRQWAATREVGFVDLFPLFLDAGPAAEVLSRYVIRRDFHWNEAGHALVADAVARAVDARRLCR